ncbi:MAG: succinate--CoA ligase subunit alpha [Candidatus Harrisonbacteria bacterium CG10_big_fil_rev_8_21_14_0_10_45_28]|uniref:Succinate--CoA ligase subunit alpha n=1 Tax=Candidatus Harrisonbacteria bacterium CG10_big_fil_rev_8_21_14_0_10_45_28 TaxID=1974586 RepID=A0A2H0UNR7_9BACT|nr:MAG: succinate--CoA ligase subunit alpha [Candidatus Harrisonbacteria bacterium CG10_big_fil_rev_8_21_14_0_10_45_28]
MAILINKRTRVLVQGITGHEGSRATKEMLDYGTEVVAGVTPGKGGQRVEAVHVYNTVKEAKAKHPDINASLIIVPAFAVKDATLEAMFSGIKLINILTELVPPKDCAEIYAWSQKLGCRVVGPASVGIISPGLRKIGSIGSGGVSEVFTPGPVGVVSKSGGMTSEISIILTRAGLGQSTAVGIGGEQIIGSDFVDILELFESDKQTKAIVIFGEVGGTYEERVAEYVLNKKLTKPIVAIIGGKFTSKLPQGTVLGHAGAIVSGGKGSYDSKVKAFKRAGIKVAPSLEDIPKIIKSILK